MINRLSLRNFKGHVSTDVALRRLTVLVGPNGAGKTTVLQALQTMAHAVGKETTSIAEGAFASEMPSRGTSNEVTVSITSGDQSLSVHFGPDGGLRRGQGDSTLMPETRLFRFEPSSISKPSYTEKVPPSVDSDGNHTASVLAALKLGDDPRFEAIAHDLRQLVPTVVRLKLRQTRTRALVEETPLDHQSNRMSYKEANGHEIVFDFIGASDTPARAASEGTLIALSLLTVLHTQSVRMVLIDDIERALHPEAQMQLMRLINGLLDKKPDVQIVATTHSPYILDAIDLNDVLVLFPRADGTIAARPLSEHPNAKAAIGALSPGQIWTLDPERWVVEPHAGAAEPVA